MLRAYFLNMSILYNQWFNQSGFSDTRLVKTKTKSSKNVSPPRESMAWRRNSDCVGFAADYISDSI